MPTHDRLSSEFLSELGSVLRHHNLRHGVLTEGTPYLNLNVSDRSLVFVKIARTGDQYERAATELVGTQWANTVGLNTCIPLVDDVLTIADGTDAPRAATVWRWLEPVTPPALYDQAQMVADLLIKVAHTPAPEGVGTFDVSYFVNRGHLRLLGRTDTAASLVRTALDESATEVLSLMDPARHLWIHGDLHFQNVLWQVTGKPALLDWESHVRGPVEFDIAQLFRSVYLHFPKHALSEKARAITVARQRLDAGLDVDWVLVEAFARFRGASSASHLLVHGQEPRKLVLEMAMLDCVPFRSSLAA